MTESGQFIPLRDHLKDWAGAHIEEATTIVQETSKELGVSNLITERGRIDEARDHLASAALAAGFIPKLDRRIDEIRRELREVSRNVLPEDVEIEVVVYKKPPLAIQIPLEAQGQTSGNSADVNKDPNEKQETPIENLNLSVRAYNSLRKNRIYTVEQLQATPEDKLLKYRNFGANSLAEVREKLTTFSTEPKTTN